MAIFITGGSGLLGRWLVPKTKECFSTVLAPTHKEFDITKPRALPRGITTVVNLAAFVDVAACQKDPLQADLVNNRCLGWLTSFPETTQIYHISTDYVYNGWTLDSKEEDPLDPWCVYGRSKADGDTRLLSYSKPNIHIIRTSFKDVKWPYPGAFTDVYTNADTVDIISEMILQFILSKAPGGVYNIGTEAKSLYDLAKRNNTDVKAMSYYQGTYPTLRPCLTMDLVKFHEVMND